MYLRGMNGCRNCDTLRGLGYWGELVAAGMSLMNKGGDSASGGGAQPGTAVITTTSTNINTNVSPQISPNFIQQQDPTNSAVNASSSMTPPSIPGFDAFGYPPGVPVPPRTAELDPRIALAGAGIAGVLLLAIVLKKKGKRR